MTYVVPNFGLPHANVLTSDADNVTLDVDDAGTSTAGTDIDADVVLLMNTDLIVRIDGQLPRLLSRVLSVTLTKGQVGLHDE